MRGIWKSLGKSLEAGKAALLVSIIASHGSVPRGAGAHMVVNEDGRKAGTIGGGEVEHVAIVKAVEACKDKLSYRHPFCLRANTAKDLGMVCGGDVETAFCYIPADAFHQQLLKEVDQVYEDKEALWLLLPLYEGAQGALCFYTEGRGFFGTPLSEEAKALFKGQKYTKPRILDLGKEKYYVEQLVLSERVYIFGGGHVAQALVPVLAKLGFRCIVAEDREDFCSPALFPEAESCILIDNTRVADFVDITEDDYLCIMTRGHQADTVIQAQVMRSKAHYIGLIGSRRKIATVQATLREQGFDDADFARVTTPIGLPIQAETPEEIAVSIAAQLIMVRANRQ